MGADGPSISRSQATTEADDTPFRRSAATFTLYGAFNAFWRPLEFELPAAGGPEARWRRVVDTSLLSPEDFCEPQEAPVVDARRYRVASRSVVFLMAG